MGGAHTGTRGQIHQMIGLANLGAAEVAAAYDTVAVAVVVAAAVAAVAAAVAGRLAVAVVAAAAWVKA